MTPAREVWREPRVFCVMVPANKPATKELRFRGCEHKREVPLLYKPGQVERCAKCECEGVR